MPPRNDGRHLDRQLDTIAPRQAKKHSAFALRVTLFALSAAFAVAGVFLFLRTVDTQTAARTVAGESVRAVPVRQALLVCSDGERSAATSYQREGVTDVLNRSAVACDVQYLESGTEGEDAALVAARSARVGGYDLVFFAGDEALAFGRDHAALFDGIPKVFFGVTDADAAQAARDGGETAGIVEKGAAVQVLAAARVLQPGAGSAVVLTDGSPVAAGLLAQLGYDDAEVTQPETDQLADGSDASVATFQSEGAPGLELHLWDTSRMTHDQVEQYLGALDGDTFVLNLGARADADGAYHTASEATHFVCEAADDVPVYNVSGGMGEGACGNAFVDVRAEAEEAAGLGVHLLNGTSVADAADKTVSPETLTFDVKELEAHGLDPDAVPAGSTLVNVPLLSVRALRPFFLPVGLLLVAIVCISGFGIIGYRRSVGASRALIASRNDLQYRLYHDMLTELPNRFAFTQFVEARENAGKVQAVVQLDIDDFTDINDSYGHDFGNRVIQIVGERLQDVDTTFLARSGGDEFMLAFDHRLAPGAPEIDQIGLCFEEPVVCEGSTVEVRSRAGVANREPGMPSSDLVVYCDLATHEAKNQGIHDAVFYTHDLRDAMEKKLEITSCLKQAIADESVVVLWQPQVETATLEMFGYEALCRLEGNRYFPDEFIPVAEMSGLVGPLDRIMTKKVIAQLGAWLKRGRKVGVASINFSVAQLRDTDYCDFLADLLRRYKVPADLVKIEITESMVVGNEKVAQEQLGRLRELGVTLALDDFGTGYSSLARMASMPVDFVKLDKSLVDRYMVPGREGFIEDITHLIHGIGKKIVVEGVETAEQYEICLRLGCDIIQGYFFARPLPVDEVAVFDPRGNADAVRVREAWESAVAAGTVPAPDPVVPALAATASPAAASAPDPVVPAPVAKRSSAKPGPGDTASLGNARNPEWSQYPRDSRGRWTKGNAPKRKKK